MNRKTKAGKEARGGARPGAGAKKKTKADKMTVGSIRMKPGQWKLFDKWGGPERLRKHLDAHAANLNKVTAPA